MDIDYALVGDFLESLAVEAGEMIKTHGEIKKMDKGMDDVVTDLDLLVEKHCLSRMAEKYPQVAVVSEEFNFDEQLKDVCFIIDPIDGTKNFAMNLPFWSIQLAFLDKGEPVVSVIHIPQFNVLLKSVKGQGVVNNGKKVVINQYDNTDAQHSLWLVEGKKCRWDVCKNLASFSLGARCLGSISASMALFVSRGGFGGGVIITKGKPWDILPGYCACKNAGLPCAIYDNGKCILASNQKLFDLAENIVSEEFAKDDK